MEPLTISNPKLLDCCNCFQPLSIPVFQCDNGHVVCSTCCPKLRTKCHKCSLYTSSKRCKAIENLLLSIQMPCPNAKYGCLDKVSYTGNRKHEEECIHRPCYCPHSGCDFVATSKVLSNHFSDKHKDSQIRFSYGHSFIVSLKCNDESIVFQEENDGKLFILSNSTMILGNAVNICCIGLDPSESIYNYDILARSQTCKLKLQSFAKNVQRFTLATLSSEFLVVPFGSSEPLKLEICINPHMMQIFIVTQGGERFPLMVKSSDRIFNVMEKILEKKDIPVHSHCLLFDYRRLDYNLTLANYNVQENSTLMLMLHQIGD